MISSRWLVPWCVALVACSSNARWPASMEQQPAVLSLAEARSAPLGSIPLGGVEVLEDRDDAEDLQSPTPLDAAASARGAKLFAAHCVPCHGSSGRGDGPVSEKFPEAPNVRHYSICRRTNGFLYGTLTTGGRAMPAMREGLTSRDRWDLVAHVRALQKEGCTGSAAGADPASATPSGPSKGAAL